MNTPQSKSSINSSSNKLINSSSSDSPAFQDSPVFNYISNLSPIQPVKAEPGAQGFPGLASPPLVFTSPRNNSLQSLLNRKLQSSGSLEFPQVNDKCHKNDGDSESSAKAVPEFNNPFISKEPRACNVKNLGQVAQCSPGCVDDFLSDPDANSSCKRQSDNASQSQISGSLGKRESGTGGKLDVYGSTALKVNKGAQAKSRISIKVVKNEACHFIPSSECMGSSPRLLTEHAFEICQNGDSLKEASNLERGTLRRCLFEENQRKSSDGSEFRNFSDNITRMEEICNFSSSGTPDNRELINHHKPASGASCVSPVTRRNPVAISKPLGIGLHLNSVVYPRSLDSSNAGQLSSLAGLEGKSSVLRNNQLNREVNATIVGKVSAISEKSLQNNGCSVATSSEAKPSEIEHHHSPVLLKPDTRANIACIKRKISPETAENNEVSIEMSAKKKRKKSPGPSDNDHPKRCNCKKTKCLKLYCDCFAAGLYCTESCACQGCCNRPGQESMVLETRQQIESRNPLAFAPKVVRLATDSPASNKEVQNVSTPASARHKRGCNCKKSMCLKKYCECYQGNVGCSDGCRCEGCKNVFGIREDYRIIRGHSVKKVGEEMSEANMDRSHESTSVGSNFGDSRLHNTSPNLTLATPASQCSDLRKNALKPQLPCMRFLRTPDAQNDVLTSDENFLTCPEKSIECIDEGAFQVEKSFENTEDNLQSVGDECTSTPVLISNSMASFIIPSSSSKTNHSGNTLPPPFLDESVVPPPPMSSSLRWRSSPVTPISQSAGLIFQDFDSASKNSDMIEEDETPDVLKDSSNPANSVKVSSPNKKRISAPQNPIDSSTSLRNDSPHQNPSDSSGSLKVCHRFVLRALPTFPSLTPFSKKQ